MALRLTYLGETSVPVELEGFTPDWARDKSLTEIERFEIHHGNRRIPLAEMFRVTGDPTDERFEFTGDLAGVHWIGAHLKSGVIQINGNAGRHVGDNMCGGEIHVAGNVDGWLGAEMHGGLIRVRGNAGDLVGAAFHGAAKGMTGGTILIDGNAGDEVGQKMRRGLIAIGGNAGDMIGCNLIAGTVLVFGGCGIHPGAGMRRGTIGIFGPRPSLLLSFRYATTCRPQILPLMLRRLRSLGMSVADSLLTTEIDLYAGDFVTLGRGEMLLTPSLR